MSRENAFDKKCRTLSNECPNSPNFLSDVPNVAPHVTTKIMSMNVMVNVSKYLWALILFNNDVSPLVSPLINKDVSLLTSEMLPLSATEKKISS